MSGLAGMFRKTISKLGSESGRSFADAEPLPTVGNGSASAKSGPESGPLFCRLFKDSNSCKLPLFAQALIQCDSRVQGGWGRFGEARRGRRMSGEVGGSYGPKMDGEV